MIIKEFKLNTLFFILTLIVATLIFAQGKQCKIHLKNGDIITGEIISQTLDSVVVKTEYIEIETSTDNISSISYNQTDHGFLERNKHKYFEKERLITYGQPVSQEEFINEVKYKIMNSNDGKGLTIALMNGYKYSGDFISFESGYINIRNSKSNKEVSVDLKSVSYILDINNQYVFNGEFYRDFLEKNRETITVKEYEGFPLLIVTIGAGIYAYTQLDKAHDLNEAADVLRTLGLDEEEQKIREEADEKTMISILSTVASGLSFLIAINPTEKKIPINKHSFDLKYRPKM
ncbi:MAG: hypothetical protein ACTSUC_12130 [Promethearchaeota archaeon]